MDPLPLLDELRIHAKNGLRYADDPYDEALLNPSDGDRFQQAC